MRFELVNMVPDKCSDAFVDELIATALEILQTQFCRAWEIVPPTIVKRKPGTEEPGYGVYLVNSVDVADAAAYHSTNPDGNPVMYTAVDAILSHGGTLGTGDLSVFEATIHELEETLVDPYGDFMCVADDGSKMIALEVNDPFQGSNYRIGNFDAPNFAMPAYFRAGKGQYDWLSKAQKPFELLPQGYQIVADMAGVREVYGQDFLTSKKALLTRKRSEKRLAALTNWSK